MKMHLTAFQGSHPPARHYRSIAWISRKHAEVLPPPIVWEERQVMHDPLMRIDCWSGISGAEAVGWLCRGVSLVAGSTKQG